MNIKIPNKNKTYSKFNLTEQDLYDYLEANFPDNPKGWKEATMEVTDMVIWLYEYISDMYSPEKAEPLKDVSKSKTPKEWNTKHKARIVAGMKILNDYQKDLFFSEFGFWISNWKSMKPLNESVQKQQHLELESEELIEDVLSYKKNQSKFDCELFMGTIKSGLNTKFGLLYHVLNTDSVESFIISVQEFIETSGEKLTQFDIERLTAHYNKFV